MDICRTGGDVTAMWVEVAWKRTESAHANHIYANCAPEILSSGKEQAKHLFQVLLPALPEGQAESGTFESYGTVMDITVMGKYLKHFSRGAPAKSNNQRIILFGIFNYFVQTSSARSVGQLLGILMSHHGNYVLVLLNHVRGIQTAPLAVAAEPTYIYRVPTYSNITYSRKTMPPRARGSGNTLNHGSGLASSWMQIVIKTEMPHILSHSLAYKGRIHGHELQGSRSVHHNVGLLPSVRGVVAAPNRLRYV